MSIDTITINLDPTDVVMTTTVDPNYGPQYTLTIEKSKAAFLAKFILSGLTPDDQARIPVGIKEDIIQGTGLKYVFRLPSITRSLLIGTAIGVALKTFSDNVLPQYFVENAPKLLMQGVQSVQAHPYISAATLVGSATLSTLVSQEAAQFVSDILEGTKSLVTRTANIGLNGLKAIKDACCNYPKTAFTIAAAGIGATYWYVPSVQHAIAQKATDLIKKIY